MSNLAINDAGDILAFDGKAWKPASIAQNDQGAKLVFDGAEWQPIEKVIGASKGSQAQGRSDALASAVGRGVTFGAGDELGASVRAALPGLSNWMMGKSAFEQSLAGGKPAQTVSDAPTYDQRYEEELARMRGQAAADKEAYPTLTTAGELGGNVLGTAALAYTPYLGALVRGGGGAGLATNMVRGAATGAALGGAQGFAEGEGGFDNRLGNAVMPAAIGGAVGAAAPVVGKGIQWAYERAAPTVLRGLADMGEKFAPKVQPQSLSAAAPDGGPGIAKAGLVTDAVDALNNAATSIENKVAGKAAQGATPAAAEAVDPAAEAAAQAAAKKQAEAEAIKKLNASMTRKEVVDIRGQPISVGTEPKQHWSTRLAAVLDKSAADVEEQAMLKRLSAAMQGRNGVDATEAQTRALGENAMVVDANKATKRLGFATQANSDDAAQAMEEAFKARNQMTGTTFKKSVPGAPDPSRAEAYLEAFRRAEGGKIYDPVLRGGQAPNVTPEMEALMQRKSIKDAFKTVDQMAAEDNKVFTEAERLHRVKRALNLNARAAIQKGEAVDLDRVAARAREWEQALWKANPEIKAADAEFAKIAGLHEDWFKRGQAFAAQGRGEAAANASPEALAEVLRDATPLQKQVFQAGASAEMRRISSQGGDATRRLAKVLGEGDDMVARLTEVYGPEKAQEIIRSGDAQRVFAETYKDVMRGSQTAERGAALRRDADLMPPAVQSGGDMSRLLGWMQDIAARADTPSETVRRRLASVLTDMDAKKQKALFDAVREFQRQQSMNTFKPGVAGSAAAVVAPTQ